MHKELKAKAVQLRIEQQLSYNAILRQVPVAKSTLHEWLKHFPLSNEKILELKRAAWKKNEVKIELFINSQRERREQINEEIYQKYRKQLKNIPRKAFFVSGLMLYLAEGGKTNQYNTILTNTDPRICKFFIKWLLTFFPVERDKLRIFLQLYPSMDVDKEVIFWLNELSLKREQVYKPHIRKLTSSSFVYKESFRHGTCAVTLSNAKIKRTILMAIRAYLDAIEDLTGV